MKLIETKIVQTDPLTVEMTFADTPSLETAKHFIHVRVPAEEARDAWRLPAIQRVALQSVRDVVSGALQDAVKKLDHFDD